jgi:hypothetical protein
MDTTTITEATSTFTMLYDLAKTLGLLSVIVIGSSLVGCASQMKPMTDSMTQAGAVVSSVVQKANNEAVTKIINVNASAQMVEPGVETEVMGIAGYVVYCKGTTRLKGVGGQGTINSTAEGDPGIVPMPEKASNAVMDNNFSIKESEAKQLFDKAIDAYMEQVRNKALEEVQKQSPSEKAVE